jgi:predicted membrane-bound mannosyltransferase
MKTQRRPDRGRRKPQPDRNLPAAEDLDMELESELPDVEEFDTEEVDNGAAGEHVENGAGAAVASVPEQQSETPPRPSTLTLPRRRPRIPQGTTTEPAAVAAREKVAAKTPVPEPERVVAPPPVERTTRPRPSVVDRVFRLVVTYEGLIYLGIFLLALVTRLWDLGPRGIHHDESLHSVYSRNLYIGTGYQHDPMMHGPLQFHFIAGMYWLFGDTDATARLASVFSGIFVVMSPFFLRRQMGRWPALAASFLFLISPSILYFSRMAREDSIFSGMEMIMIVGLWRFVSTRRPADFFLTMAGLSLMFTIKETAYLSVAVMGIFFVLMFAFQAGWAIFGSLLAYGAVLGGFYKIISDQMKAGQVSALPNIPVTNPDYNTIMAFVQGIFAHPLVQGVIAITLIYAAVLIGLFYWKRRQVMYEDAEPEFEIRRRPVRTASGAERSIPTRKSRTAPDSVVAVADEPSPNGHEVMDDHAAASSPDVGARHSDDALEIWDPKRLDPKPGTLLAHYQAGSLPHLLGSLLARPSVIVIGLLIASAIFVVLYTVFFTDLPRGIVSGIFASLGYWMAQHDVERGGQPWYYYSLLIPLYEPIAVFFSLCAGGFFGWKGIRGIFRRRERLYETGEPGMGLFNTDREIPFAKFSVFLPAFTIWWLAGAFFIYSWAGEKMPWLMVHMVRPAILLAALFLGALAASLWRMRQERLAEAPAYEIRATHPDVVEELPATALPARRPRTSASVPTRRSDGRRAAAPVRKAPAAPVRPRTVQDPPWVSWNRPDSRFPAVSFVVAFVVLAMAWGMKMNALTNLNNYDNWGATWVYPGLMAILLVSYAVWLGPGRSLRYLALGIFGVMFLYQFRSAVNWTYQHPDVPIEMGTYVQTSPDVTRTVNELEDYSYYATGARDLKVAYDSFTSWPYEWYLRNYKNKQFIGGGDPPVGPDMPVMFLEYAKHSNDPKLQDYMVQRYAMRWWFPEEWYKNEFIPGLDPKSAPFLNQVGAALNTARATVTEPQLQATLWKYLAFREPPKPLGSEDMVIAIRKDIAQMWHRLQFLPPDTTDIP